MSGGRSRIAEGVADLSVRTTEVKQVSRIGDVVNKVRGVKNSAEYVKDMDTVNAALSSDELYNLVLFFKKIPMNPDRIEEVIDNNLKLSETALKNLGMSDEDIANSAPRRIMRDSKKMLIDLITKMKKAVKNPVSLTWGTWAQTADSQAFKALALSELQKGRTKYQFLIYSKWFASVCTMNEWLDVCLPRAYAGILLLDRLKKDGHLNFIEAGQKGGPGYSLKESGAKFLTNPDPEASLEEGWDKTITTKPIEWLMAFAAFPDFRQLLMSTDIRQSRTRATADGQTRELELDVVKSMSVYITAWTKERIQGSLDPKSVFCQTYFACRALLHRSLRNVMRDKFGGSGGPNTRREIEVEEFNIEFATLEGIPHAALLKDGDKILKSIGINKIEAKGGSKSSSDSETKTTTDKGKSKNSK